MRGRESERGAALVIALVFAAAMAAAAVAFMGARQSDAVTLRAQAEAVQAEAMLHAALNQTVALIANKTSRQVVPPQLTWVFQGVQVRVTIENETGKVDINKAEEPLLKALPMAVGLRETEAAAIADTILDWRDENKLKRPNGAEDRDYAGREHVASAAANRPFAHPSELRYLPSVDAGIWARLAPFVTIYSGADAPEPTKAPPTVRQALTIARGLAPSRDESAEGGGETSGQGKGQGLGDGMGGTDSTKGTGGLGSRSGSGNPSTEAGRLPPGERSGLGSSGSGGSGFSRRAGAGETGDEGAQGGRGDTGEEGAGVQTVVVDVRFPNGYEAAARAVIGLDPDPGSSEPYLMLDWTPFIPPAPPAQGGRP